MLMSKADRTRWRRSRNNVILLLDLSHRCRLSGGLGGEGSVDAGVEVLGTARVDAKIAF